MLRLHLELRWRDSVLLARSFGESAWAGPTRWAPFPLEGFDCPPPTLLAARTGDTFVVYPPPGAENARPVRLAPGQRVTFRKGELSLRAKVSREEQVLTLDWLWVLLAPLALAGLWKVVQWFGVVFGLLLLLLPHAAPRVLLPSSANPKLRAVKVVPVAVPLEPVLPEHDTDRLRLLMDGKRSGEIFAAAQKKADARQKAQKEKVARDIQLLGQLSDAKQMGILAVLSAGPSNNLADVFGSRLDDAKVSGGLIGSLKGSELGSGGLGLRGSGVGGGGTGVGLGGLGTVGRGAGGGGSGQLGELAGAGGFGLRGEGPSKAVEAARQRAREGVVGRCFLDDDAGAVTVRLAIHPDGSATPRVLHSSAPGRVGACLTGELAGWKLPQGERESSVVLRFVKW